MEYKQNISWVGCGWAMVQIYERCLLHAYFFLILFDELRNSLKCGV